MCIYIHIFFNQNPLETECEILMSMWFWGPYMYLYIYIHKFFNQNC